MRTMKAFHRVQLPALLLLAYTTQLRCCAAKKPDLDGLTDEEAKYAKLYWDYTVADRVIHTATNSGGGADTRANEAHITAEETRSGYRFFVPHFERLSGLAYVGHGARLRLVLERASSGEALHMGVLGGSISCGVAARSFSGMYAALFKDWLNAAMPPTYTVGKESAATAARRSVSELAEEQDEDWYHMDALLGATAARTVRRDGVLHGVQGAARIVSVEPSPRGGRRLRKRSEIQQHAAGTTSSSSRSTSSGSSGSGSSRGVAQDQGLAPGGNDPASTVSTAATTSLAYRRARAALAAALQGSSSGEDGHGAAASRAAMDDMGSTEEATVEEGADAKQGHGEYAEEEWEQQDEEGEREEEEEQQQGLRHTLHNGAIPGTLSSYMSSCMQYHIPLDKVDIVFVEYAVNDRYRPTADWDREDRRAYERLLRKLLNLPQKPAVVMVQMYPAVANDNLFWMNAERDFNELARYYGIPAVSLKGAVMPAGLSVNPPKELQLKAIFNGGVLHPGQGGHVVTAELLITLAMELFRANHHLMQVVQHNLHEGHSGQSLQASSRSLLKASMSKLSSTSSSLSSKHRTLLYGAFRAIKSAGVRRAAEARGNDDASVAMLGVLERAVSRPLPPPLAPDNWETGSTTCYLMEQLEAMAVAPVSAGWNWTDEGRNKWGWVAMEAKQAIRFKVSTALAKAQSQEPIQLQLSYLQSYRDMGTAKVSCESGCECSLKVIDSYDERPVSVSVMANLKVSQHSDCVLQVVTQGPARGSNTTPCPEDPTKSCRGSKFKITGIVVGEEPGGRAASVDYVRTNTFEIAKAAKEGLDRVRVR